MKKLTRILSLIIFISATTTRPAQEWTQGLNLALSAVLGLLAYGCFGTGDGGTRPQADDRKILQDFVLARSRGETYSSIVNRHTSNNSSPNSDNLSLVLALLVCCGAYAVLDSQSK